MRLTFAILLCVNLSAADFYVRHGASGDNSGSDWTNARSTTPTTWVRGNTYWFADGTYGGGSISTAVSGTNWITLKKATVASHGTDTGWADSYGDGQADFTSQWLFKTGYLELDGQIGGGPDEWTDYAAYGFRISGAGNQISVTAGYTNFRVAHVDFNPPRRFKCEINTCPSYQPSTHNSIYLNSSHNWTITHSALRDINMVQIMGFAANDVTVEYCYFARNGPKKAGYCDGGDGHAPGTLHNKYPCPTYGTAGYHRPDGEHGDGAHREAWSGTNGDRWVWRWNLFEDISNTGILCLVNGTGDSEDVHIYGNIFARTEGSDEVETSNWLQTKYASPTFIRPMHWRVYNNTIYYQNATDIGAVLEGSGIPVDCKFYNNLWVYCGTSGGCGRGTESGYNSWFAVTNRVTEADLDATFAASETGGQDLAVNPLSNPAARNYGLTADDATDDGMELPPPFNVDMYGATRGSDGHWNRGAIEFESEEGGDIVAPTISGVSAIPAVTTATIAWTTDELSTSGVEYGPTVAYGLTSTNASYLYSHSIGLAGLNSATTYHFKVWSTDGAGNTAGSSDFVFTTAQEPVLPVTAPVRHGKVKKRAYLMMADP